ncbi:MAG: glycosyltransferase [Chthoniobacterales bacterium]
MKKKRLIVMGFMGSCPIAGVIWQHLHYIIGLQRLGHDVFYIEDSARLPYNPETFEVNNEFDYAARLLQHLASEFGFRRRWSFCARYLPGNPTAGLPLPRIRQLYGEADAILNVCGTQEFNPDVLTSERILYIESDPGVEQIKVDQGNKSTIKYLKRHHALFSFGENVGTERFPVPTHNLKWLPTRQPIVTDFWKTNRRPGSAAVFTSVANWSTSGLKDIEWRGEKYLWSKSREFIRFVAAPKRAGETFELATDIKDDKTREKFLRNGWRFRGPHDLSADYRLYRDYIRRSKGEFTVAKDQYVRLNTGWFSDRSGCYLAAGRPVIIQETGFTTVFSGGRHGLIAFQSLGEIAEAVKSINADYTRHSLAAREIARQFFEAEKVLRSLLERAGI